MATPASPTTAPRAHGAAAVLEDFLAKIAGDKAAAPLSEPGGYTGPSTHPSTQTDDGLITERTGFRYAENSRDAKDSREQPSVDATSEIKPGAQDEHQLNIGTDQSATGEDPSVEDDFKGNKDDPGTTSVMKADDGKKYAEYRAWPLTKLAELQGQLSNSILATIINGSVADGPAPKTAMAQPAQAAAQAGYDLAAMAGGDLDKHAAAVIDDFIAEGELAGELLADFVTKVAEEAGGPPDAGQGPPPEDGAPGMAGGIPPEAAAALMGGGGGGMPPGAEGGGPPPMDGGGPPPDMGGPPPGAEAGPPPGADGGMPPGGGGGEGGGGNPVDDLAAAFVEMGLSPEELMQVAQAMQAHAGGGGPEVAKAAALLPRGETLAERGRAAGQIAKAARKHMRSGRFAFKEARGRSAETRAAMRQYITETVNVHDALRAG